jgi:hypothetical protein
MAVEERGSCKNRPVDGLHPSAVAGSVTKVRKARGEENVTK